MTYHPSHAVNDNAKKRLESRGWRFDEDEGHFWRYGSRDEYEEERAKLNEWGQVVLHD